MANSIESTNIMNNPTQTSQASVALARIKNNEDFEEVINSYGEDDILCVHQTSETGIVIYLTFRDFSMLVVVSPADVEEPEIFSLYERPAEIHQAHIIGTLQ